MSNLLLFGMLTVLVLVNAYFTYRRTTDVDDTGRKLLAASQLIYLVFIGIIFVLGKIVGASGVASKLQGGSMPAFIAMAVGVAVVLALVLFGKTKLERKILGEANSLGIGPMGLGGKPTLLAVKIAARPRVPASFFVTVAYMCWALRRRSVAF